jgi:zinc D-Ala-D-Ala carboxypeptidase
MSFYRSFVISVIIIVSIASSPVMGATGETIPSYNIPRLRAAIRLPVFYDDSSVLRFVSRTTPLSDRNYAPRDLTSISGSLINQAGRNSQLRKDARDALWNMASGFYYDMGTTLTVISGYRSADYQQRLWDLGRCSDSLCAPPGYSEHQLGLAVDLFDASSEKEFTQNPTYRKYVKWLENNAYTYGWTQSYQKWIEIDEYQAEPWHYRYVGVTLATRLHTLGWTYTEFVRFQEAIARR